jgi:hypothetical protein
MNRIVVLRVFGTAAYISFISSVFVPFLQAQWIGISIPEMRPGLIRLWSFKGTFSFLRMMNGNGIVVEEYWFADYWCRVQGKGALGVWIEPLLIFIFEAQVLTFPTVISALWKMKCSHFLLAFLLNVFILSCMSCERSFRSILSKKVRCWILVHPMLGRAILHNNSINVPFDEKFT